MNHSEVLDEKYQKALPTSKKYLGFIMLSLAAGIGVGLLDYSSTLIGKALHPDKVLGFYSNYCALLLFVIFFFSLSFVCFIILIKGFHPNILYSLSILISSIISLIIHNNYTSGWAFFLLWGILSISVYIYFDDSYEKYVLTSLKVAHTEYFELFKLATTLFIFIFVGVVFTYTLNTIDIPKNYALVYFNLSLIIGYLILCASFGILYSLYMKVRKIRKLIYTEDRKEKATPEILHK